MPDSGRRVARGDGPVEGGALLVLARPSNRVATVYCRDHLAPAARSASAPVVVLTDRSPSAIHATWADEGVAGVILSLSESTPSDPGAVDVECPPSAPPSTITAAANLGTVGRTIDEYLVTWSSSGDRPTVCVDSVSGLLAHGSVAAVYRFLYVLLRRVEGVDGAIHVHADPRRHEEEILRTYSSMFDRVISFQDGSGPLR